MGKSKKAKKAEERKTREAKQKGKKNAVKKAKEEIADLATTVAETKLDKKEVVPIQVIDGCWKSTKNKVHAVNKEKKLVCKPNETTFEYIVDKDLTILDLNCKHCSRLNIVKKSIADFMKSKPKEEPETIKPETIEEVAESKAPENIDFVTIDQARSLLDNRIKFLEKRLKKSLESFTKELFESLKKPTFYMVSKIDGTFAIIHEPSRYVIVENLTESECDTLLPKYLDIGIHWNGFEKMPKPWLTQVTKVFKEFKETYTPKLQVRRKKKEDKSPRLKVRRRR